MQTFSSHSAVKTATGILTAAEHKQATRGGGGWLPDTVARALSGTAQPGQLQHGPPVGSAKMEAMERKTLTFSILVRPQQNRPVSEDFQWPARQFDQPRLIDSTRGPAPKQAKDWKQLLSQSKRNSRPLGLRDIQDGGLSHRRTRRIASRPTCPPCPCPFPWLLGATHTRTASRKVGPRIPVSGYPRRR